MFIYLFKNEYDEVIYVGKTISLTSRINNHITSGHLGLECYAELYKIEYASFNENEFDMMYIEQFYINKFLPKYNEYIADLKYIPNRLEKDLAKVEFKEYDYKKLLIKYIFGEKEKPTRRSSQKIKEARIRMREADVNISDIDSIIDTLEELQLKKKHIASLLGVTYNTLRRKILGEISWSSSEIDTLRKIVNGNINVINKIKK